jgi:N-acetylglutamate synthase-like GNAT family acetyltransferase
LTKAELRPPESEAHWRAFHALRRIALFAERGRGEAYDADHPDDRHPADTPLLDRVDGGPVGVLRLDRLAERRAAIRRVAIERSRRGEGHGRRMIAAALERLREAGVATVIVASAPGAVGFYEALGFVRVEPVEETPAGSVRLVVAIA